MKCYACSNEPSLLQCPHCGLAACNDHITNDAPGYAPKYVCLRCATKVKEQYRINTERMAKQRIEYEKQQEADRLEYEKRMAKERTEREEAYRKKRRKESVAAMPIAARNAARLCGMMCMMCQSSKDTVNGRVNIRQGVEMPCATSVEVETLAFIVCPASKRARRQAIGTGSLFSELEVTLVANSP